MTLFSTRPPHVATLLIMLFTFTSAVSAQEGDGDASRDTDVPYYADIPAAVTAEDAVTIGGESVPYRVTADMRPVLDDEGEAIASLFYVYYERSDVDDRTTRPLVISFNGGPGSASLWMHLGYTSPVHLRISPEGFPIQPYGIEANNYSIIDVADIVYVNPVNTGFSRIAGEGEGEQFFGVNEDIAYLAEWVDAFVSEHNRWTSPKFLIGESYGTTRVAGLAAALQDSHWMFLNGVVLVSPTGLGIERGGPVGDALTLPYFTATAWYHDALVPELQSQDLAQLLPEVERFTIEEYIPALARGGSLDGQRRSDVAAQVARYAGLTEQVVLNHNLTVPTSFFWKELLRERGLTVGRLDSRYRGIDNEVAGPRYDYDPALTSWNHMFAPAINHYLRGVLGYETDLQYWLFGPTDPWNRDNNNTGADLGTAMLENPFLHLMIQSGYYDGGTDYFSAKYSMWQINQSGKLDDRIRFRGYRSGHMMYLRDEDRAAANEDIRAFIQASIPEGGQAARY